MGSNLQISLYRPIIEAAEPTHCSCALPEGAWGGHGWHWMRATRETLFANEKARFAAERQGLSTLALRQEWAEWLDAEAREGRMRGGLHETWKPYLGLPFAMEPCPAYRAAYGRSLDQETARKKTKTGRRKLLGEES